jgi:hypothetical protein
VAISGAMAGSMRFVFQQGGPLAVVRRQSDGSPTACRRRRQSGQRFEQAFHNRCRKSVEPMTRPIECQRCDAIRNLLDKLLFHLDAPP